ncbi:DUF971 domain-containing protein [Falsiroseomonas sp.]|uniref:DUF971 domain-containing protein n=1 Tax=Falsiroseomonas sp. TaxID=2870721 RepID=UPI002719B3F9|nr:DUF971 domain-containing protein [Falsiroseomonas sp.]MDO9501897.1 DUF971 domain-containing protein [Falsiroseomonas sp.]
MPTLTEIRLSRADQVLHLSWDDGVSFALPAEYLRVESPSAEVQGHGPGQRVTVAGRRHVGIMKIEPVGHYAVRLVFDDLHDSGIYAWDFFRVLGEQYAERWAAYEAALAAKGLSRDPPKRG